MHQTEEAMTLMLGQSYQMYDINDMLKSFDAGEVCSRSS